jgi:hypothetical protein
MTGGRLKRVRGYLGRRRFLLHLRRRRRRRRHRANRIPPRRTASWPRSRRAAARPLWRAGMDGDARRRLPGKAARRRRLDQWRLLRAVAAACSTTSTATRPVWEREPLTAWPRRATDAAYEHAASGSRWTPCATRNCSKSSVARARRPGRNGDDDRGAWLLARPARLPHRPYRLQGRLAGAVAAEPGAEVHGYALPPPTEPNLFEPPA